MISLFILNRTYIPEIELVKKINKKIRVVVAVVVVCVWDNASYGEVNLLNL